MSSWQTLESKAVYENPWMRVREDQVINPAGNPALYGVVEFKNRGVGIVPLHADGSITLVRQTRYATGCNSSLELPEGGCPHGENWFDTARRELQEETGLLAEAIEPLLLGFHVSNSITNETGALFVATGLSQAEQTLEESEDITVERHPFDDVLQMVKSGIITDGYTIMGILCLAAERSRFGL
ncbi:MAG: NUDIX domain-containing protein [Plesiomonas shigelloides]